VLAKAVQEDSTFQEAHKEVRDLPTPVDTSTTPAVAPAEATGQSSPLRRRHAAGLPPTTLAQAGATSGGGTSSYGSSSTTYTGDSTKSFYQGLALGFGVAAAGAGIGIGISESQGDDDNNNKPRSPSR